MAWVVRSFGISSFPCGTVPASVECPALSADACASRRVRKDDGPGSCRCLIESKQQTVGFVCVDDAVEMVGFVLEDDSGIAPDGVPDGAGLVFLYLPV